MSRGSPPAVLRVKEERGIKKKEKRGNAGKNKEKCGNTGKQQRYYVGLRTTINWRIRNDR